MGCESRAHSFMRYRGITDFAIYSLTIHNDWEKTKIINSSRLKRPCHREGFNYIYQTKLLPNAFLREKPRCAYENPKLYFFDLFAKLTIAEKRSKIGSVRRCERV